MKLSFELLGSHIAALCHVVLSTGFPNLEYVSAVAAKMIATVRTPSGAYFLLTMN